MSDSRTSRDHRIAFYEHYRRQRRKFALKVYFVALIFLIISFAQWTAFMFWQDLKNFLRDFYYFAVIFLLIALLAVTAFVFLEGLRFMFPFNWILSLVIVECITLGLTRALADSDYVHFGGSAGVVLLTVTIAILIGMLMPVTNPLNNLAPTPFSELLIFTQRDLTFDVVILFVCTVLFFFGSVFFLILAILADIHFSILIYSAFIIATVLLFLMYHAQTISGSRYAEMRLKDYLLAALIIYHDFVILYMLVIFIFKAFLDNNMMFNIYDPHGSRNCTSCQDPGTHNTPEK